MIVYIDRKTGLKEEEKVYGHAWITLFYGEGFFSRLFSCLILPLIVRIPLFSWVYGVLQKMPWSRKKIRPFIQAFDVETSEFLKPVEAFASFNDFFVRKLKKEVRPMNMDPRTLIMPADGRYLVFPNICQSDGFWVKGKKFDLSTLLHDEALTSSFEKGSMALIRLCPVDYHRFHFPCDGRVSRAHLLPGFLHSVNPLALKKSIEILSRNKRMVTEIQTDLFGKMLYIEVGALNVGSIRQTFTPGMCHKGEEKGFFEFGGSCLILLFEEGKIQFDQDLIQASKEKIEVKGLLGQSLGICK